MGGREERRARVPCRLPLLVGRVARPPTPAFLVLFAGGATPPHALRKGFFYYWRLSVARCEKGFLVLEAFCR